MSGSSRIRCPSRNLIALMMPPVPENNAKSINDSVLYNEASVKTSFDYKEGDTINPSESEPEILELNLELELEPELELNLKLELELELDLDLELDVERADESLASTIIQEIEDGVYVCLICTCEIDRLLQIWSCLDCFRVYDLECIRNWATRGSSTTAERRWRCPSCHVEHCKVPNLFKCWCGRQRNPTNDCFIPFSCGNVCGHKYETCVHKCLVQCHPGKHPTCGAMGPNMHCKCGTESQQLPCLLTPYQTGWKCKAACEIIVCDMGHRCVQKTCHDGLCGRCQEHVRILCYCGAKNIYITCFKLEPKPSINSDGEEFIGGASCGGTVRRFYDCGVHYELKKCQPQSSFKSHCKLSPDVLKSCYCGKTSLEMVNRVKCTDPIPVCENACEKQLLCGCLCKQQCHAGPCECFDAQKRNCKCGFSKFLVPCKALAQGFEPYCTRKCTALLSCRKHVHRAECCPYEQPALKRERENKRLLRNNLRSNFTNQILTMEPCHICTRDCSQLLKCGVHRCRALCHSGACGVCLESSAEDLICNCGKTVVPAPVRCGTEVCCTEPCLRISSCGHRPERHYCHGDEVSCPKCTFLVLRTCDCGLKSVKNVLCSVKSASCGNICRVPKDCGHPCNRACLSKCTAGVHTPVSLCQFECQKIRQLCPHLCILRCHSDKNTSCDRVTCNMPIRLTCDCGNLEESVVCGASLSEPTKLGQCLPCNADCALKAREKELSAAFNVSLSVPVYSANVLSVYRRQRNWCRQAELKLLEFISSYERAQAKDLKPTKALHFPRMLKPQRDFIHNLSRCFRLYSESYNKEPKRAVFVYITEVTKVPNVSIEQAIAIEDEAARNVQFLEKLREMRLDSNFHNAVLIKDIFFGVSKEVIERSVVLILKEYPDIISFSILWVKNSNYVFTSEYFVDMTKEKEDTLRKLLAVFRKQLREDLVAFDCRMCFLDEDQVHVSKVDNSNVAGVKIVQPRAEKGYFSVLDNTS